MLKCTKIDFGCSASDPTGGAYSAPPDPLAGFKGPTSKGKGEVKRGGEGRKGKGRGGEGRKGERRGGKERRKGRGAEKGEALRHFSFYNLSTAQSNLTVLRRTGGEGKGGRGAGEW